MNLRENWRIVLLVAFVVGSAIALFVPGAPPGTTANETAGGEGSVTNLQYGIQLDGGTRIRAPVVGITAEGVNVAFDERTELERNLSQRLGVDPIDVRASNQTSTVEVFVRNVSQAELRQALEAEGYQPETIRDGVTESTRQDMVDVIDRKISESALSGGSVQTVQTPGGEHFISITAPDRDREELKNLLDERGVVRVYAFYPNQNGTYVRTQVLQQEDFEGGVGAARERDSGPGVPVTITDKQAARNFSDQMVKYGFDRARVCRYDRENPQDSNGQCLLTTLNGEVVFSGGVEAGLARLFRNDEFVNDPSFVMTTTSMQEARELELSLKAGRLRAPLDFENAQSTSLEPALANRFKSNSLIIGIGAVVAVSLVVYGRYRDPRVAAPMVVTALSEVLILLGFVAMVQYPLNLSHIAGFIAVIGTGVDDLIIMADEILQQKGVATGRVFQSRFRKAFWVIGAAAATTIVAMSPLTVLSLGDLSGFAIVTIVGVLIGVLVTRPAYGDILRNLLLQTGASGE
ncbi:MAG: preprotein translocase subunit SecD [Haloarculaceae archaeon]